MHGFPEKNSFAPNELHLTRKAEIKAIYKQTKA
jgi:hypothetical protein